MYLWTEQDDGAVATELSVRDLELRWQAASWLDPTDGASPLIDLDGTLLRRDTGGVYRVGSASTDLLTTGDLVSTGANHLLLRECDATRLCTLLTVDRTGERRAWPLNLPPDVRPQLVGGLSPAGDALLFNRQRVAADVASDLGVLELADGTSRSLRAPPGQELTAAWDTAGAGVVVADFELMYIDRFTGETTIVAADLPILRSASTRRPAATPACRNTGHLATTVRAHDRWRQHQHRVATCVGGPQPASCGPPGRAGRPGSAADHLCDRVRVA